MLWSILGAATLCATGAVAYPRSEVASLLKRGNDRAKADAVKEAFHFSWNGYMKYAFPNDELKPTSNSFGNSRNGWGASAVDALSTALLMGDKRIVNQILDHIVTIDYEKTSTEVSLFETTIRYLGGMLSAYDLLKGPLSDLSSDSKKVDALLTQSKNLADALKFAFDTTTGIPHNGLWFTNDSFVAGDGSNGLATTGTLILEWTRLSDLTGDPQYADLTRKAESYLINPQPPESEFWPGLVSTTIDIETGNFLDLQGGWGGGRDSFYEYLIKMYVYDPSRFFHLRDRWILAANHTIKWLTSQPVPRPDITFVAEYDYTERLPDRPRNSGHLACFHGGNFLLGGSVLKDQRYIDYGLRLVDGCHATYNSTITQIGPEGFSWDPYKVPDDQRAFYEKFGFYITSDYYNLRPEVIESIYHAYRITGNTTYQDWIWDAFVAINGTARRGSGFTAIANVNMRGGGASMDNQESFWFAEVLKYCYLAFAPDAPWQVSKDGKNEWVYNTEAHPLKVNHIGPGH